MPHCVRHISCSLPEGPLQSKDYQEVARPVGRFFCFWPWPYKSKLLTATARNRNASLLRCDFLIIFALRREGDSNSRYPFGVYTLSRRAS